MERAARVTIDACAPWLARLLAVDDLDARAPVIVGCSGGADSLALLALMCARGFDVAAVYVDHGLRGGTDREAAVVRDAAARFGAHAFVERVAVVGDANLEARARDLRYAALEARRAELGAQAVAVAHTVDDQAETVLLNMLRGGGLAGLAGMPVVRGSIRRPLLGMRRADTRELCLRLGLAPVHDPMNSELRHRRVWLRREIIPRLEAGADRDVVAVLARQAELMRADTDALDEWAAGHATDDAAALAAMPTALARRVVRSWIAAGGKPPALAVVDRVLAVARGDLAATELPGGDRVDRQGGRLTRHTFSSRRHEDSSEESPRRIGAVDLAVPGRAGFGREATGEWTIDTWVEHAPPVTWPDGRFEAVCDADAVGAEVVVRPAERAERFRPLGATGSKLVRDALAEAGVPARRRGASPVVAAGGPVWVVGYRIDHRVRVTATTRRYLWMSAEPRP